MARAPRGLHHARVSLRGPLTFLSTRAIEPLRAALDRGPAPRELLIDLAEVTALDISGAEMLAANIA